MRRVKNMRSWLLYHRGHWTKASSFSPSSSSCIWPHVGAIFQPGKCDFIRKEKQSWPSSSPIWRRPCFKIITTAPASAKWNSLLHAALYNTPDASFSKPKRIFNMTQLPVSEYKSFPSFLSYLQRMFLLLFSVQHSLSGEDNTWKYVQERSHVNKRYTL